MPNKPKVGLMNQSGWLQRVARARLECGDAFGLAARPPKNWLVCAPACVLLDACLSEGRRIREPAFALAYQPDDRGWRICGEGK